MGIRGMAVIPRCLTMVGVERKNGNRGVISSPVIPPCFTAPLHSYFTAIREGQYLRMLQDNPDMMRAEKGEEEGTRRNSECHRS